MRSEVRILSPRLLLFLTPCRRSNPPSVIPPAPGVEDCVSGVLSLTFHVDSDHLSLPLFCHEASLCPRNTRRRVSAHRTKVGVAFGTLCTTMAKKANTSSCPRQEMDVSEGWSLLRVSWRGLKAVVVLAQAASNAAQECPPGVDRDSEVCYYVDDRVGLGLIV